MNKPLTPQLVYFEPIALDYPLGKELKEKFENMGIETRFTTSHNLFFDVNTQVVMWLRNTIT